MLRKAGNTILYILMTPVRILLRAIEWLVTIRSFTDVRRRDLAVLLVVAMMVLVAIKLRYSGYADAHAVEYMANALPDAESFGKGPAVAVVSAESASEMVGASKRPEDSEAETMVTERPNVAVTVAASRQVIARPVRERTLILPMPNVVPAPVVQPSVEPAVPVIPAGQTAMPVASSAPTPTVAVPELPAPGPATGRIPTEAVRPKSVAAARLTGDIETAESDMLDDMIDDVPVQTAGSGG